MLTLLKDFIDFLDKITIVFTFITMILTIKQWRRDKLLRQSIIIELKAKETGKRKQLPQRILRKYLSRAELKGILSDSFKNKPPYKISFLTTPEFSKELENVQQGKSDKIVIILERNEEDSKIDEFIGTDI